MLAIVYVLICCLAGRALVSCLPLRLRRMEWAAMSVVIGIVMASWLCFLLSIPFGVVPGLSLSIIVLGILAILPRFMPRLVRLRVERGPYSVRFRWLSRIFAVVSAGILGRLYLLSYNFKKPDGSWWTNGSVWGDGPVHLTLANQFAYGARLDWVSHFYLRSRLNYPFLFDFYSAMMHRLGSDWTTSFLLPTLLVAAALLILIFGFGWRLLGSARAAWLQYMMLIFSGSVHTTWLTITTFYRKGYSGLVDAMNTTIMGDGILNFPYSHLLPQRAFLLGMPLLIVVGYLLLAYYSNDKHYTKNDRIRLVVAAGLAGGLLPLVHNHSFLVLAVVYLVLGVWWLFRKLDVQTLLLFLITGGLALPQFLWQMRGSFSTKHFFAWIPGWRFYVENPSMSNNLILYWLEGLGVLAVALVLGWAAFIYYKKLPRSVLVIYIVSIILFVMSNIVRLQPSTWDNMKLLEYSFWGLMLLASWLLAKWSRSRVGGVIVTMVLGSLTLGGFIWLLVLAPTQNYQLFSNQDIAFAESLRTALPQESYILTSAIPNNPTMALSDHPILVAYEGWTNLSDDRLNQVSIDRNIMLRGLPSSDYLIRQYGLSNVVFSDFEEYSGSVNGAYFSKNYKLLSHEHGWWLYDLKSKSL